MSIDAIRWALMQPIKPASTKLLLISFCDRANEEHMAWPSIMRLALDTGLDAKTITSGIQNLIDASLLIDTGERKGRTGKVRVYQLVGVPSRDQIPLKPVRLSKAPKNKTPTNNNTENGCIKKDNHTENGVLNHTENGVPESHRKRCLEPVILEPDIEPVVEAIGFNAPTKFRMHLAWKPKLEINEVAKLRGITEVDPLDPGLLDEFCRHWSGESVDRTDDQWFNAYLSRLKWVQENELVNGIRLKKKIRDAGGNDKNNMGFIERHSDTSWACDLAPRKTADVDFKELHTDTSWRRDL